MTMQQAPPRLVSFPLLADPSSYRPQTFDYVSSRWSPVMHQHSRCTMRADVHAFA